MLTKYYLLFIIYPYCILAFSKVLLMQPQMNRYVLLLHNYWRLKKQTFLASWTMNIAYICICESARLFPKEADIYSQARRATGRRIFASASRVYHRKSHLFHHFTIRTVLLRFIWSRHRRRRRRRRRVISRTNGDRLSCSCNKSYFYWAQGGESRSRLKTDVLFLRYKKPTFLRDKFGIW